LDLDVRTGDVHVFDEQAHQLLSLGAVELIDDAADLFGEVGDAPAEQVAACESGAFGGERGTFSVQFGVACGDFTGAALQLGHFDQAGLEEIDESTFLRSRVVDLAVQASELCSEQLVIGDRLSEGYGLFAGQ
jgi:hypothetical protein